MEGGGGGGGGAPNGAWGVHPARGGDAGEGGPDGGGDEHQRGLAPGALSGAPDGGGALADVMSAGAAASQLRAGAAVAARARGAGLLPRSALPARPIEQLLERALAGVGGEAGVGATPIARRRAYTRLPRGRVLVRAHRTLWR